MNLRRTWMCLEYLPQPLHHGRHAPDLKDGHDERADLSRRQLGRLQLHRDELRDLLPAVQPAADEYDRVLDDQVHALLVGSWEEQHLDRALEILQHRRSPGAALPGDLALDARQDSAERDYLTVAIAASVPFRLIGRSQQLKHRAVGLCGQHVLKPEQRMVGDVQAEHLPLEAEES